MFYQGALYTEILSLCYVYCDLIIFITQLNTCLRKTRSYFCHSKCTFFKMWSTCIVNVYEIHSSNSYFILDKCTMSFSFFFIIITYCKKRIIPVPSILLFTGCPNASYYGNNCSTSCHQNCLDGRCDVMDGTCLGCIQGYTGSTCDTGCNTIVIMIYFYGKHNVFMYMIYLINC